MTLESLNYTTNTNNNYTNCLMIKRIINKIYKLYYTSSSNRYIKYLKKSRIKIGKGCIVLDPKKIQIDISRPELLEIGDNVLLHRGTVILTHDYASRAFVTRYNEFIPSHGKIKIGNNVWLGENVSILKGVSIGNNVILGYGSIVTKSIPSNSVAVGSPAKVICTFDDYFKKRKQSYINECFEYANSILDTGRELKEEDFYDDYPIFVNGSNFRNYNYPYHNIFNDEQFGIWRKNHKSQFNGFEEFVNAVKERRHE